MYNIEKKLFFSQTDGSLDTVKQLVSAHNSDQEVNKRNSETDDSFDTSEQKARLQSIREVLEKGNNDVENWFLQSKPKRYFCVDFIFVHIL